MAGRSCASPANDRPSRLTRAASCRARSPGPDADLAKSATRPCLVSRRNATALFEWRCNPDSKLRAKWIMNGGAAAR
eukprot:4310559-Pyramimonas_sp.AAC.1